MALQSQNSVEFSAKVEATWQEMLPGKTEVPLADLKDLLDEVGIKLPMHQVRTITDDLKKKNETNGDNLSKAAFVKVCRLFKSWKTKINGFVLIFSCVRV